MKVNISYLEVPMEYQENNWNNSKLNDNMWITAEPHYKNIDIEFDKLIDLIKSDYRQYSPFEFLGNVKKSENWNNSKQDLIIFDIDDGLTLNEAKSMFKDHKYLIATTKSHQKEKKGIVSDRFRVIIPGINIPSGDDYFDMFRVIEDRMPFIDKQVNTKTGSFLGNFNCEYYYNDGKKFDCDKFVKLMKFEKDNKKELNIENNHFKQHITQSFNKDDDLPIQEIKNRLTRDIVASIVSSCGYEVNRKYMFKYRKDERTPSASISPELLIKDFGSDLSTDAIGFVMETQKVNFKEASVYVAGFVGVSI